VRKRRTAIPNASEGKSVTNQAIENYGIIGDTRSAALISITGSLDWLCFPIFDSPTVFAALLDEQRGGSFSIAPDGATAGVTHKQFYWPDTNVLVTRFLTDGGVGEVIDFMPIGAGRDRDGRTQIIRQVTMRRGSLHFALRCQPAFNYGRDAHAATVTAGGVVFTSPDLVLELASPLPLTIDAGAATAHFTLKEGESATFVLREHQPEGPGGCGPHLDEQASAALFKETVTYWRAWLARCTYTGRWREIVWRSALALKLLTYSPTGAIIAAPTCGLPEEFGGASNWDYRFTWLRDSAFTVYAFLRIGFTEEAAQFIDWLGERCGDTNEDGSLQPVYGIDGRKMLPETNLDHLGGYRDSRPVRIGNAITDQLQPDIYGAVLDAVYLFNKHGALIPYELWTFLRGLADWVCAHWQEPDNGIWETREGRSQYVYSKVMSWVALDRAMRLADKRSFPANYDHWRTVRDAIYEDIIAHGWNEELATFTQIYGGDQIDAAVLIMPLVFFMATNDSRMRQTIAAVSRPLRQGGLSADGMVYRNRSGTLRPDGIPNEGAFSMCTFWLVEALTRGADADPALLDEARLRFEQMLGYANHLGLYAEELGMRGEAMGNYPQAFTHMALISAAYNLDRRLGAGG